MPKMGSARDCEEFLNVGNKEHYVKYFCFILISADCSVCCKKAQKEIEGTAGTYLELVSHN